MSVEQIRDCIEFYDGDRIEAIAYSSMVPHVGDRISIRSRIWAVTGVFYALDYADNPARRIMRASVDLRKVS